MVKKGPKKGPSHQDLVKTVSKQLKYYFEIRRQEDGFDLSGPECPRPDYPALKSRPMLLYEGLHDRSVKHFYSEVPVKQKITHMTTYDTSTAEAKRMEKLMKKTMDRTSYLPTPLLDYLDKVVEEKPPWAGTGMYGEGAYTKNSEKYLAGTFGDWKMNPKSSRRRGYGKPDNTLKNAFTDPPGAKPRLRRSCPSGWIDNKECNRLVHGASRILASSEFREGVLSRPQSSKSHSQSSTRSSQPRARSASPRPTKTAAAKKSSGAQKSRLIQRPQSGRNTLSTQNSSSTITRRSSAKQSSYSYHDAKDQVVKDHEDKRTSQNLKKGRIYYDIDGRRKPVQHKVKNEGGYMEREGETAGRVPDGESSDEKVPDWLKLLGVEPTEEEMERNQMRRQDVNEKKMPYNNSVKPVEVTEKTTAQGEDVTKREGVRARRPRSARRSKSRDSRVTLSEGSYEEVKLTDSEDSEEETFVEDRGCQTGWELFVQYDQTENILYDGEGETATYKIIVRTGNSVGASTKANVHVVLYGPRGRSTDLMLTDCENHKIPFQQGAEDIFYVTCSYVGDLRKIQIGHDSEGEAWFLDSVSVQDQIKGEVYELLCNKWMSIKAEDKMTRRHLQISATRKIEPDIKVDEEEDETSHEDVIDKVHTSNSPRPSVGASTTSKVSTSHLNNETDTAAGSTSRKQSSLSLPSDTASTSTITKSPRSGRRRQEPYVTFREGNRGRRSPDNIEDFESDVPLQSDKRSVSSRRSESPTVTDSECQTARFEEQSVLSGNTEQTRQRDEELAKQQEMDRLESFKAGQRAERERQRVEKLKHKESEAEMLNDIMRGPTIHQAAKSGDLARINKLLEHNNELKDSMSGDGHTPLHLAAQQGHKEVVQLLAALGAKLDERDRTGYEPTHEAALYGHVNCLMILVAMGASINSKTDDSKTPLHLAAMGGHLETTKWLVANRSRLQVEDDFGRTAVDMAENNGHDAVAKVLRTCINELKSKRTSLESLLVGNEDGDAAWKDDKAEMPIVQHQQADSDDEGASLADLRRDAKKQEEAKAKQKAYQDMQQSLQQENMTFLDRVRNEVDTS